MNSIVKTFRKSAGELKKLRTMTVLAMLVALHVILHFFFSIKLTDFIEIRFAFLTIALAGAWFGPLAGAVVGALGDVLSYMLKPTGPFFPGWTLNAVIIGLIYGIFLYQKAGKSRGFLIRVITAKIICAVVVEILLMPLWLSILYGNAYFLIMQARIVKTVLMLPIDCAMIFSVVAVLTAQFYKTFRRDRA